MKTPHSFHIQSQTKFTRKKRTEFSRKRPSHFSEVFSSRSAQSPICFQEKLDLSSHWIHQTYFQRRCRKRDRKAYFLTKTNPSLLGWIYLLPNIFLKKLRLDIFAAAKFPFSIWLKTWLVIFGYICCQISFFYLIRSRLAILYSTLRGSRRGLRGFLPYIWKPEVTQI